MLLDAVAEEVRPMALERAVLEQPGTPPSVAGCPFDPLDREQVIDPHPWFREARKQSRVFYDPAADEWWVTHYEDCLVVLRDTETYSSSALGEYQPLPGLAEQLPDGHPLAAALVATDPPDHTRLRRLAQPAFTPRAVAAYEPEARAIADRVLDGVVDAGRMDLYREFAQPLTIQMICGILGVSVDRTQFCLDWLSAIQDTQVTSPPMPEDVRRAAVECVVEFDRWIREFIEVRRADPRDDLTSRMIHATSEDGTPSLTTWEVVRLVTNVLTAGFATSASLVATTVFHLLRTPERWERVKADRTLIPAAVEEALRYDNVVRGLPRRTTRDTVLANVAIPRGAKVIACQASAMRDEAVFADPQTFDLDRADLHQHFGFGRGTHMCLGAPLARLEATVALERLADRLPELRLADAERLQHRRMNRIISVLTSVQVEWR
jgi:cytochrome P450